MFLQMTKLLLILVLMSGLNLSCGKSVMNINEIALPIGAKQDTISGSYEVALDRATNSILANLKKSYSKVEERILFLSSEATEVQVFSFFDESFQNNGMEKIAETELNGKNYKIQSWQKSGWFGNQTISVAVIEVGQDEVGTTNKFLAIYSAEK
jgi:hypothetical protein